MAKRQNFVVGSTNPNTESLSQTQLNRAWDRYAVLKSGVLDGTLNAISDYSNDSSNEIANAIMSITGSQPTGASQTELAEALGQMRQDIETSSLTFKGYVATTEPSSSTYGLVEDNLWINSATLPTSFPVAATDIKVWDGSAWVAQSNTYTAADFDFWRNVNDNEGYYWFGGQWVVMSTDMSTTYFTLNQTSGKWEIKDSVNLPGTPTVATPARNTNQTSIVNRQYVDEQQNKQAIQELTADSATIVLQKDKTIYFMDVTNDLAITINATGVVESGWAQTFEIHLKCGSTLPVVTWTGIDNWLVGSSDTPTETDATSIFVIRVQQGASDVSATVVANYGGAY